MKSAVKSVSSSVSLAVSMAIALSASSAFANDISVRFGFEFGGETLASANFSDGSSDTIKAGSGEHIELGYSFKTPLIEHDKLSTELSLGYKSDSMTASNLDAYFDRTTATVTQYYTDRKLRYGVGLTRHFGNTFRFNNLQADINISHGLVLSADYFSEATNWFFGGRFTKMDYTETGINLSADSFGLHAGYRF